MSEILNEDNYHSFLLRSLLFNPIKETYEKHPLIDGIEMLINEIKAFWVYSQSYYPGENTNLMYPLLTADEIINYCIKLTDCIRDTFAIEFIKKYKITKLGEFLCEEIRFKNEFEFFKV